MNGISQIYTNKIVHVHVVSQCLGCNLARIPPSDKHENLKLPPLCFLQVDLAENQTKPRKRILRFLKIHNVVFELSLTQEN